MSLKGLNFSLTALLILWGGSYEIFSQESGEKTYSALEVEKTSLFSKSFPMETSESQDQVGTSDLEFASAYWSENIAVGADGVIHVVWSRSGSPNWEVAYSRSNDNGTSWTSPIAINDGYYGYKPAIAIDPNNAYIVWVAYVGYQNQGETRSIRVLKSTDGGFNWNVSIPIYGSALDCNNPDIAIDSQGNPHVVFDNYTDSRVRYNYSTDGGQSWITEPEFIDNNLDAAGFGPTISIDKNNNPHVVFGAGGSAGNFGDKNCYWNWRNMNEGTWQKSPPLALTEDENAVGSCATSLIFDSQNVGHLWYDGLNTTEDHRTIYYRTLDNSQWSKPTEFAPSQQSIGSSYYPSAAIDENDNLYLIYFDDQGYNFMWGDLLHGNNEIFIATNKNGQWQFINYTNEGFSNKRYRYPDAARNVVNGKFHILYTRGANTPYEIVHEIAYDSESPDLSITHSDISFNPPIWSMPGTDVLITASIKEKIGFSGEVQCLVSFYWNDKSNLIGSQNIRVSGGSANTAQVVWNTTGLANGNYNIIVEISNSEPEEKDIVNNEAQKTFLVRDTAPSIQERIDLVVSGDTVWVEPGTYEENIRMTSGVAVKSLQGPEQTIIDGGNGGTAVDASGLGQSAVLDGFTVRNGTPGIDLDLSSATIQNNIIESNKSNGIWHRGFQTPLIQGNLFINNAQRGFDGNNSQAILLNNTFVKNPVGVKSIGFFVPSPTIVNCIFWDNGNDLEFSAKAIYSNIKDGDAGFGNISADPEFVDPVNGDYHLQLTSPCLDSGDPTKLDRDGTRSDMGAYAVFQGGGRFGVPIDLTAEDTPDDNGGQISLKWESPPPVLEVSTDSLTFEPYDLGWAFFLANTGLGRLSWTATSDAAWLELVPQDGITMLGNGQLIAIASRQGLGVGDYPANIHITSNGGDKTIGVLMKVGNTPEPGDWSGSGVSFDVTSDMSRVANYSITVGPSNNRSSFKLNGSVAIEKSDQTFSIESGDIKITGKFDTRTSASGTYVLPPHSGNWSASWSSNSSISKLNAFSSISGQIDSDITLVMGYQIYRSEASGDYDSVLVSVAGDVFSHQDTTVVDGIGYYYTVRAFDQDRNVSNPSNEAGPVTSTPNVTSIDDRTSIPLTFDLLQNYPNPFNPETTVKYQLPTISQVNLEIFNIVGQRVTTLVDNEQLAGFYSVQWNGKDESGRNVASGIYLYKLKAEGFVKVRKLTLLR